MRKLAVTATIAFFSVSCHQHNGEHDHGNGEDTGHHHDEHADGHGGAIRFTDRQFRSLGMKIGTLGQRNLGQYIEANGRLEVPPQNQAAVTTFIGANAVSIEVIEGDKVSSGQVLAYISHPDLVQFQADYLSTFNRLSFLEKDYLRKKKLYNENVGSGKELQTTEAEFLSSKAKKMGLEAQLRLLGLDPEKIRNDGISERVAIVSPINGHVRMVGVKTGQYVDPQTEMFEIVNVEHVHADLVVFEKDVHKVKEGQHVIFSVEGHEQFDLQATIYSVGKAFEKDPKAIHLHAEIENKHGSLLPGMYVRGRILTGTNNATALPEDAVVKDGERYVAFTVTERGEEEGHDWEFAPFEVIVGERADGWTEIKLLSEPEEGTEFAWNNAYYLIAEMKKGETEHSH